MALFEDLAKGATPGNLVLGVGAALLAPVLAPAVSSVLRPAARAVMRTGITLYRGAVEPVSAAWGNLVAEAQMELATASNPRGVNPISEPGTEPAHKSRTQKQRGGSDRP